MRVEEPLSTLPRLGLDAELIDLDLEKVTDAFAFGEITGSLDGEIRDIVTSPLGIERFAARLGARESEGRPARASLKAIRQIPYLSAEGRLTLQGTLFNLFNAFGYSRFGAVAVLDGDLFDLRGRYDARGRDLYGGSDPVTAERPAGKRPPEYLFLGSGLFPKLDILIERPVEPLSFHGFLEQLREARNARLK